MREHFLLDPATRFLNHGSFGACPLPVLDALHTWQRRIESNPVQALVRESAAWLLQAREALAAYLGADAAHLVFVPNATTGVNVVARSLKLQPGDEVLCTDMEYGACEATFAAVCNSAGAVLRKVVVPLPLQRAQFAQHLLAAAGPRTRFIFCSHIVSVTALVLPVAELCQQARAAGLTVLIDGAHAPGQRPLHLNEIGADFYTGNCHKWLCGAKGSAFLHARPEHHHRLRGLVTSWGDIALLEGGEDRPSAHDGYVGRSVLERRLQWQGTHSIAPYLAVPAAIDFVQQHLGPDVRQRCHHMALDALQRIGSHFKLPALGAADDHAQMVSLPVPPVRDAPALQRWLFGVHRIEVPVVQHAGRSFVRLSVQGYNTQAEVDHLCAVLQQLPH